MSDPQRVIRRVQRGGLDVTLGTDASGRMMYVVRVAHEAEQTLLTSCPHLPQGRLSLNAAGEQVLVLEVPSGKTPDQLGSALNEELAIGALTALAGTLAIAEAAGCPLPSGVLDERLVVLRRDGTWCVDLMAACLRPGGWQEEAVSVPAVELRRLCHTLLQYPRLRRSRRIQALDQEFEAHQYRSAPEWEWHLTQLTSTSDQRPAMPTRYIVTGAAAVLALGFVIGAWRLLAAYTTTPIDQAPVVALLPEIEQAPDDTPAETPVVLSEPSSTVTAADILALETMFDHLPEPEPTPSPEPPKPVAPAPPPPPPRPVYRPTVLPGPYCELGVQESRGDNRYLVLNGSTLCTAHVHYSNGLFISHGALRRLADTTAAKLTPADYVNANGELWIAVRADVLLRFQLELVSADGETIALNR